MKRRESLPIDLTPLIDVVFILLIFFIVSSVFKKEELALMLDLPSSHAKEVEIEQEQIAIELGSTALAYKGEKISFEELENIDGIGLIVAQSIIDFFQNNNNSIIVKNCFTKGVSIKKTIFNDSLKFSGEIFVITGSFNSYSRLQIKELLEREGGRVTNSISSKTNYLVVGDNPGSKLEKARKNNVKIINEDKFKTLLEK